MDVRKPDPDGLQFWSSKSRTHTNHHGVTVDILVGVHGPAHLIFDTHTLFLFSNVSVKYRLGHQAEESWISKLPTVAYIPKGMPVDVLESAADSVTIIHFQEDLFRRAMRGTHEYDGVDFRFFMCNQDHVLLHSAALIRSISLDPGRTVPALSITLINEMVVRILQRCCEINGVEQAPRRVLTPAHVSVLTSFIDRNLRKQIRLSDLSDMMSLSQSHFAREFKAATNTSPMRYVLERRVEAAKVALAGPRSLAEVALDTGFASQSHFTTAFRDATGVTPAVFRGGLMGLMVAAAFDWLDIVEFAMFPFW